ncbi:hypothetical protein BJ546DRAFT_89233 [Cryomyces antarcticus]
MVHVIHVLLVLRMLPARAIAVLPVVPPLATHPVAQFATLEHVALRLRRLVGGGGDGRNGRADRSHWKSPVDDGTRVLRLNAHCREGGDREGEEEGDEEGDDHGESHGYGLSLGLSVCWTKVKSSRVSRGSDQL